jgi:drug/metabolite transporter (DMT)-like permease
MDNWISQRRNQWIVLILLSIIWGSSFIYMKKGMVAFSTEEVAALRVFIAGLAFLPIVFMRMKKYPLNGNGFVYLSGMVGNLIPAFLFTKAISGLDSGIVGVLNALTPLFALFFGYIWLKNKVSLSNMIGVMVGILGTYALLLRDIELDISKTIEFAGYVVLATICYGFNVNLIKKKLQGVPALVITSYSLTFCAILAGIYLFAQTDFLYHMETEEKALYSLSYTAILGLLCTSGALYVFNELIKKTTPVFAASCTYIIPIFALLFGLMDGEVLHGNHILGTGIILIGVYLVNTKKRFFRKNTSDSLVNQKK